MNDLIIEFWTDGAYSSAKEAGGWALYCPEYKLRCCGNEKNTTNNRMEVTAAIKVLEFCLNTHIPEEEIVIYSDSKYLVETMNGHYQKKTNLDLWDVLDTLVSQLCKKKIIFKHVKGHANSENNNTADLLANLISKI